MAENELILKLKAENRELKASLTDTEKRLAALEGAGKKSAGGLTESFKSFVNWFKGGVIVSVVKSTIGAIVGLVESGTTAINKMNAEAKRAETVFGHSLGLVREEAKRLAEILGVTEKEFLANAAAVGDLLIPVGFTRKEAALLSNQALEVAGALKQFTGDTRSASEVANILAKSFLGEREQLKTLGVAISEVEVQSRILANNGGKKLEGSMLAQAKATATMQIIVEKSADALTAFRAGQDETLSSTNKLTAAWGKLKENALKGSEGILQGIAKAAYNVVDAFNNLSKTQEELEKGDIARLEELVKKEKESQAILEQQIELRKKDNQSVGQLNDLLEISKKRQEEALRNIEKVRNKYFKTFFLEEEGFLNDIEQKQDKVYKKPTLFLRDIIKLYKEFTEGELEKNLSAIETNYNTLIAKINAYYGERFRQEEKILMLSKLEEERLLKVSEQLEKNHTEILKYYETEHTLSIRKINEDYNEIIKKIEGEARARQKLLDDRYENEKDFYIKLGVSESEIFTAYQKEKNEIIKDQNIQIEETNRSKNIKIMEADVRTANETAGKVVSVLQGASNAVKAIHENNAGAFISSIGTMAGAVNKEYGAIFQTMGSMMTLLTGFFVKEKNITDEKKAQKELQKELNQLDNEHINGLRETLNLQYEINNAMQAGNRAEAQANLAAAQEYYAKLGREGGDFAEFQGLTRLELLQKGKTFESDIPLLKEVQSLAKSGDGNFTLDDFWSRVSKITNIIKKIENPGLKAQAQSILDGMTFQEVFKGQGIISSSSQFANKNFDTFLSAFNTTKSALDEISKQETALEKFDVAAKKTDIDILKEDLQNIELQYQTGLLTESEYKTKKLAKLQQLNSKYDVNSNDYLTTFQQIKALEGASVAPPSVSNIQSIAGSVSLPSEISTAAEVASGVTISASGETVLTNILSVNQSMESYLQNIDEKIKPSSNLTPLEMQALFNYIITQANRSLAGQAL